jgi:hypothetical protein
LTGSRTPQHAAAQSPEFIHYAYLVRPYRFERLRNLALLPKDFGGGYFFGEPHSTQVVLIGQLQDVGFVFLQVLVGHTDVQVANGGASGTDGFLGHGSTIRQYISCRVKRQLPIWVTAVPGVVPSLGDC